MLPPKLSFHRRHPARRPPSPRYEKRRGHELSAHFDDRFLSGDIIVNLSLLGSCLMSFRKAGGPYCTLAAPAPARAPSCWPDPAPPRHARPRCAGGPAAREDIILPARSLQGALAVSSQWLVDSVRKYHARIALIFLQANFCI